MKKSYKEYDRKQNISRPKMAVRFPSPEAREMVWRRAALLGVSPSAYVRGLIQQDLSLSSDSPMAVYGNNR